MTPASLASSIVAVAVTYLLGSIPTGYLVPRIARGIDIREHGSGNIGATNVGRVLGFPFFVLVMVVDLLKGFLPTYFFPIWVARWGGSAPHELPIACAAAAILGHNFPVYLRFRGGKGVATSLGAVLALDPTAGACAAVAFLFVLTATRFVSVSSILGGASFLGVHLSRLDRPFGRDHIVQTLALLVLFVMLIHRHRGNLERLWHGTEPKVGLRERNRRKQGRIGLILLPSLVLVGGLVGSLFWILRPSKSEPVRIGSFSLRQVATLGTGRQRAGDLVFASGGTRLVVACPRYNRLQILDVADDETISPAREVLLEGRPMALAVQGGSVLVLQRPSGDARHLEEGFWRKYTLDGEPVGDRFQVGWDPDDIALLPDGRHALVLSSGHAEGESGRPDPSLLVARLGTESDPPRVIAQLPFRDADDPERLHVSESGRYAAVAMKGTEEVASLDLSDLEHPLEIGRAPLLPRVLPNLSLAAEGDPILMPVATDRASLVVPSASGPLLVSTLPTSSALELVDGSSRRSMGCFPLTWNHSWNEVRPMGLAYCPERRLLAVANRAGGIHLIAIEDLTPSSLASSSGIRNR